MSCVCLFGDSVGKGVIYDSAQRRYQLIRENAAALYSRVSGVVVKNYASFGCTLGKGWRILRRHLEELAHCDRVILEFGGNDCDFDWAAVAADPRGDHQPKTPLHEFEAGYAALVEEVRAQGGRPVLLNLPPIHAPRYCAWISRGLDGERILEFLGEVERIYRWQEMYSLAVCRVAMRESAQLIDIRSAFLAERDYASLLCEDGIHPNKDGQALISQTILSASRW